MSFMFNPHPYDDMSAINCPKIPDEAAAAVISGLEDTAAHLALAAEEILSEGEAACCIVGLEGYAGAQWEQVVELAGRVIAKSNIDFESYDISALYKPPAILDKMFEQILPQDRLKDPVLLFGRLADYSYKDIFDEEKLKRFIADLEKMKVRGSKTAETDNKAQDDTGKNKKKVIMVYGCGTASEKARHLYDLMVYFDITPKQAILRAKNGKMKNLGDKEPRSFKEILRRAYYVDFELASELRGELLKQGLIDYYIASDSAEGMRMIPAKAFNTIMEALSGMPFRCKPVYIEGVWGGQFIKKIRRLPDTVKNVAWSFDMIPLEVSILVKAGENLLEFPYYTFVQKEGISIMGEACVKKFKGYFPIRFNYDDTFHGSGNMSIQVHPTEKYCRENFNEHGRQDESYYVVATGHGAKTYIGFKEGADADEFIKEAKKSERDNTKIDYEAYINSVASFPGRQCLLPAGTIHSSGRNQVVLEIGSLTIGSYTYKLYDYLRADLDGKPRPIHTYHGERVLNKERKADWVKENLVKEPILARKDEGYAEYVVGEHDLIYFSLRRLEFRDIIEDDTNGKFHVLVLVDGEEVIIEALDDPGKCYRQKYLDMVVVPANIGRYVIRNLGGQPVVVHKTMLKQDCCEVK